MEVNKIEFILSIHQLDLVEVILGTMKITISERPWHVWTWPHPWYFPGFRWEPVSGYVTASEEVRGVAPGSLQHGIQLRVPAQRCNGFWNSWDQQLFVIPWVIPGWRFPGAEECLEVLASPDVLASPTPSAKAGPGPGSQGHQQPKFPLGFRYTINVIQLKFQLDIF